MKAKKEKATKSGQLPAAPKREAEKLVASKEADAEMKQMIGKLVQIFTEEIQRALARYGLSADDVTVNVNIALRGYTTEQGPS